MKILADASLPKLSETFSKHFEITVYRHNDEVKKRLSGQDILLCRSTLAVNKALLSEHSLSVVATASSGIDHIDLDFLNSQNISLLDAKGSNASAVADYVLATIAWLQVFKGFRGKTAGVIGFGAVGSLVAKRLQAIPFDLRCYDPLKSIETPDFQSATLADLLNCDLICIHANLHDNLPYPSRHLIAKPQLDLIKAGTAIINASRGGIVAEAALLESNLPILYCTDVYSNEPGINDGIVDFATLCTPHIAGHSIEAKASAVSMIGNKLHHLFELPFQSLTKDNATLFNADNHWQHQVLSLYNPKHETQILKQAHNKATAFVQLRNDHHRHAFSTHPAPSFVPA